MPKTAMRPRQPKPCPPQGAYARMPTSEYFALDAVHASLLKKAGVDRDDRCWSKVKHHLDTDTERLTANLVFGRAAHAALLEPEEFDKLAIEITEKVRNPETNRECTVGPNAPEAIWGALEQMFPGQFPLAEGWIDQIRHMVHRAMKHDRVRALQALSLDAKREITLVWEEKALGLKCKARIDWLIPSSKPGVYYGPDYKTCRAATLREFGSSIYANQYHVSAAFYRRAVKAVFGAELIPIFIAQEKDAPYEVRVFELHEQYIEVADVLVQELLEQYARCEANDEWPGYPENTETVVAPLWVLDQYPEVTGGR